MLRAAEQSQEPDLEEVSAFLRVAETGSFTAAGRRLGLPKSTVSRRVARLEEKLGVQLLHRTTRSLALTEAGAVFHERAARALAGLEEATQAVRETQETPRGHLRITTPFDIAGPVLAPLVAGFVRRHPEVTLEVAMTDRMVDLVAENFDLALRGAASLPDSSLVARRLAAIEFQLLASPAYLKARGEPATPAELAERHDLLLMRVTNGRGKLRLRAPDGAEEVHSVRVAVAANDFGFLRAAALAGLGVVVLPGTQAAAEVRAGRLVRVLPAYTAGEGGLFLVHPTARLLPAKARAFRDFLLEHIEVIVSGLAPPEPPEPPPRPRRVRCPPKRRSRRVSAA
jgi:DNA-binding transcriptional LysR family regulator